MSRNLAMLPGSDIIAPCQPDRCGRVGYFLKQTLGRLFQMEGDASLRRSFGLLQQAKSIPDRRGRIGLAALMILAALLTWGLAGPQQPVYSLFQSSIQQSTVATPTPAPPPTNTPAPQPPTDTPVPPPTNTPVVAAPAELPAEAPTPAPSETPPEIPGGAVPEAQPQSETPPATESQAVPVTTPLTATIPQQENAVPVGQATAVTASALGPLEPASTTPGSGLVVNDAKLIDVLVEWLAYGWMCIGGGVLVLVALMFPLLHIRGKRLNRDEPL